jgi:hypothetical protein
MPFKPNYRHQRAERNRAKEEKKQEKLRRREERLAERRAAQDEQPDDAGERDEGQENAMAKKRANDAEFVLFDVLYEDGARTSNRKVPSTLLGGLDGDEPARAIIEEQDRKIAEVSGRPRGPIKSISRSSRA